MRKQRVRAGQRCTNLAGVAQMNGSGAWEKTACTCLNTARCRQGFRILFKYNNWILTAELKIRTFYIHGFGFSWTEWYSSDVDIINLERFPLTNYLRIFGGQFHISARPFPPAVSISKSNELAVVTRLPVTWYCRWCTLSVSRRVVMLLPAWITRQFGCLEWVV